MRAVMALLFTVGTVLLAVPADAGLRAVYIDIAKSRQLQIDVADNGDARIGEVGSDGYGLVLGGDFYVVDMDEGRATVARLRDIATAIDQVLPPIFKGLLDRPAGGATARTISVEAGEDAEAGGRRGRIYHVKGLDSADSAKVTDYLICSDTDLKPVGAALEAFMDAAVVPAAPLIGNAAAELIAETRAIFALGTPIDVGGRFRLNMAGKAAIPASSFRLPAAPQTVEQLVAAMKASMQQK